MTLIWEMAILKKDGFSIEQERTVFTICGPPLRVRQFDVGWVFGRDRNARMPFGGDFVGVGGNCQRNHVVVTAINDLGTVDPYAELKQYPGTHRNAFAVYPSKCSGGHVQHVYDGTTSARVYIGDTVRLGKSYFTVVGLLSLPDDMEECGYMDEELKWLPAVTTLYDNAKANTIIEDPVAFETKKLNAIYQLVRAGAPAFDNIVRDATPMKSNGVQNKKQKVH